MKSNAHALRAVLLTSIVVVCSGALQAADAPSGGRHGAQDTQLQQQRLDKLLASGGGVPVPKGIDPVAWSGIYVPADNAMTPERIALGRKLYFDTRLSHDGTVSCATCHDVSRGFTDRRNVSEGIGDHLGRRSSPTTLNAALFQSMFWDGRAPTLEEQAKLPILNPIEMGHAIASFERTLIFLDAPFDHFVAGERDAISPAAQRGLALFNGKARCVSCHMINASNPLGTDNLFHKIGVSARTQNFEALAVKALAAIEANGNVAQLDKLALETDMSELGRFVITRNRSDIGAFKTEQLRNVGITAPYMHDGTLQTLWDVVDHYNKGGETNPYLDGGIEPLNLGEDEINDLVAFLFTLTDTRFAAENEAALRDQKAIDAKRRPFRDDALAHRRVLPFETRVIGAAG